MVFAYTLSKKSFSLLLEILGDVIGDLLLVCFLQIIFQTPLNFLKIFQGIQILVGISLKSSSSSVLLAEVVPQDQLLLVRNIVDSPALSLHVSPPPAIQAGVFK